VLRRSRLRAHPATIVLNGKDVAVEGRDPLLTLHRHLEITQRVAEKAFDFASIELWIVLDQIGRTGIAELLVNTGFDEFVIQRVKFARVERISQLADEIGGPN
jgi:hypothetical protein